MSTCIPLIDDDAAYRELLHELLSEEGYAVHLLPHSATARVEETAARLDAR